MDQPELPRTAPSWPAELTQAHAWQELLHEMQALHARLEYLRLMLRLHPQPR